MPLMWFLEDSEFLTIGFRIYLLGISKIFENVCIIVCDRYYVQEIKIIKMYDSLMEFRSQQDRLNDLTKE